MRYTIMHESEWLSTMNTFSIDNIHLSHQYYVLLVDGL